MSKISCLAVIQSERYFILSILLLQTFKKYEKHRDVIIEDIVSSLAKLPNNRNNLRCYKYVITKIIQISAILKY